MFDFVLGVGLAGLAVRGWLRGFVREVLDLVSLILGIFVAFLLSAPLGDFLSDQFGVGSEVARIGSGVLLFVLFGVAMSVAAHFLSKVMRLPGLNLLNRLGGSAVATGWGILLVLLFVNIARVLPLPDGIDTALDESAVVESIAGEDAIPQSLFAGITGGGILGPLSEIQGLFGVGRVVPGGDDVVEIPPARQDELRHAREEVLVVVEMINEKRAGAGQGALLETPVLTEIAEPRGMAMYQAGRISRDTPPGGSVDDDVAAAGVRLEVTSEVLALASTTRAGMDAAFADAEASALLLAPQYDRVGISIVEGPTGVLLVIVLGG